MYTLNDIFGVIYHQHYKFQMFTTTELERRGRSCGVLDTHAGGSGRHPRNVPMDDECEMVR